MLHNNATPSLRSMKNPISNNIPDTSLHLKHKLIEITQ